MFLAEADADSDQVSANVAHHTDLPGTQRSPRIRCITDIGEVLTPGCAIQDGRLCRSTTNRDPCDGGDDGSGHDT